MSKVKNEKGSITIFVLSTMLVVLGVMFVAYFSMMNKLSSQEEELKKIQEEYNQTDDMMSQTYNENLYLGWNDEKECNAPKIKDNMELVKWDEEAEEFVPDETNSNYSYDEKNKQWANAIVRTKDENNEDIESYFVWIPRFAYKIDEKNKKIEVKFLKGKSNKTADGIMCKYADDSTLNKSTDYIIHPAFTSNLNLGGWDSELLGIWIGKYESSRSDAGTTANHPGTSEKIAVVPGVTSWRNAKIGEMYNYAKAYSTTLNSHMLKNSEWGAVAYLTESKYGRNGTEVTINSSSNCITADAGISVNPDQSSTENVYGIYDLVGGAWEYVAAYYNGSSLLSNGSSFASQNGTSTKYATAYTGTTESSDYKSGDATYETNRWHDDSAYFLVSDGPFFIRGGHYYDGTNAGVFSFNRGSAGNVSYAGFRMCLIVK